MKKKHREILEDYVRNYRSRGVLGTWQPLTEAIQAALRRIDNLESRRRLKKRAKTR